MNDSVKIKFKHKRMPENYLSWYPKFNIIDEHVTENDSTDQNSQIKKTSANRSWWHIFK